MESKEWTAAPDEDLLIPEEYMIGLNYEIIVLSSKKVFTFKCAEYSLEGNVYTLHRVIIDTSKRNARGQVTLQRVSYHEKVMLANVGFMAIPIPESEVSQQSGD